MPVRNSTASRAARAAVARTVAPVLVPGRPPVGSAPSSGGRPGPLRVLVADDNAAFRAGIVRALRRCDDVEVIGEAEDGTGALVATRAHRPDVVVVDDRMPGLGGCEVARAVSADEQLATTRVVLLTARVDPEMSLEARSSGAVACLDKAWSRREICEAIRASAGRVVAA